MLDDDPLSSCRVCPRACGVNRRLKERGFCGLDARIHLSKAVIHHGEEPCLSGNNGVGNLFFTSCNLACLYCQNHQISQARLRGSAIGEEAFVEQLFVLEKMGVHFIGLVTPSHQVPQIRSGLIRARKKGLTLPIFYNSSAYDSVEMLKQLEGLIDLYLPDLKYGSNHLGAKYSAVNDYTSVAHQAILEMYRQTGDITFDPETGLAIRGLCVRHLVLPRWQSGTWESLCFLALEVSKRIGLSLMAQYVPLFQAKDMEDINRTVQAEEYEEALSMALDLGFETIFCQDPASSPNNAIPDFEDPRGPFRSF